MSDTTNPKVYIFTSYAHEDEELKNEMDKYLKVLKRSHGTIEHLFQVRNGTRIS